MIFDKNINQLTDTTSIIPISSANKILTVKGEKIDLNKVKIKLKGIIANLKGLIGYKIFNINDNL